MMKRLNKAFTLTELLVALGVIAVLCAILLPLIFSIMPNQNVMMAKRAYYAIQTIVSEMINDESCYPDKTKSEETVQRVGFDDGFGYANCEAWDTAIDSEGNAATKFVTLFNDRKASSEGVTFDIDASAFSTKNDSSKYAKILVDTNGTGKPNKGCSTAAGGSGSCTDGSDYDRFSVRVYADGRVIIDEADTWAIEAVDINKNISE